MRRAITTAPPYALVRRLLRRMLLLSVAKGPRDEPGLSLPQYVDHYLKQRGHGKWDESTREGDFIRGLAGACKLEAKAAYEYSEAELRAIGARIVRTLDGLGPDGDAKAEDKRLAKERGERWGFWPDGWEEAAEEMREEESEK